MVARISLQQLRHAIPEKCFRPSSLRSTATIAIDVLVAGSLGTIAYIMIPKIDSWSARCMLWMAYGFCQGLEFTGIWILAHECGHHSLFSAKAINNVVGFVLHSVLLVPYFSWKYTHARHHRYTNHVEKDTAFVPSKIGDRRWLVAGARSTSHSEDAPLVALFQLVLHQLFGWQAYVAGYASGGEKSTPRQTNEELFDKCLMNPCACVFTRPQRMYVMLSNLGMCATIAMLSKLSLRVGLQNLALLYLIPYLWMNNWIIAITYLHHTHQDIPHFDSSSWTYVDGALSTVDRPFGFIGRHVFHGIIDYHVVHHLFPHIPFYHAEEATKAVQKELGERYCSDQKPFWIALWQTFRRCQVVGPSNGKPGVLVWE